MAWCNKDELWLLLSSNALRTEDHNYGAWTWDVVEKTKKRILWV